jgi:hypothetical protein
VHSVIRCLRDFVHALGQDQETIVAALRIVANEIEAEGQSEKREAVPARRDQ